MKRAVVLILSLILFVGSLFLADNLMNTDNEPITGNGYTENGIAESLPNKKQYERDSAVDSGTIWGALPLPKEGDSTIENLPNPTERSPDLLLH